ncbi:hypothetical protein B0H13DRAFT_2301032 [Mycena leptocephala]|nr:hypothetical protein B0H13DRAFT_2301032 [Mycena leptocephala]
MSVQRSREQFGDDIPNFLQLDLVQKNDLKFQIVVFGPWSRLGGSTNRRGARDNDQRDRTATTAEAEPKDGEEGELEAEPEDGEEWELEAEVLNLVPKTVANIRPWDELRDQIKGELKKKSKLLPLSKVNQLLIRRNFATLRLKGLGKMDASTEIARQWHEGEGLPVERRGGRRKSRSLLLDETVKTAARGWLMSQKVGTVTPQKFRHALNDEILPSLNITLSKDLCERTSRRWLVKLGFRRTVLRKGVYKDGHERDDVKKYRDTEFLPKMAKFEARMTQYKLVDGVLVPVKPVLEPGEKEVIAMFQDECCFHANDYKSSAWLAEDQTILQKKAVAV